MKTSPTTSTFRKLLFGLLLLFILFQANLATVNASVGVEYLGPYPLIPKHTETAGTLIESAVIGNSGTEPTRVTLTLVADDEFKAIFTVTFSHNNFTLNPGERKTVTFTFNFDPSTPVRDWTEYIVMVAEAVNVPPGASPGRASFTLRVLINAGTTYTTYTTYSVTSSTTTSESTTTTSESSTTTSESTTQTTLTTVTYTTTVATTGEGMVIQVVSNSLVSSLAFDPTRGFLNFTVSGSPGTSGFFNATIAKARLHGRPILLIDGVEHQATVTEDAGYWHIYATYLHSDHRVTIGGSETVPEYPEGMGLVLLLSSLAFVLGSRRRKGSQAAQSPVGRPYRLSVAGTFF
jgi:hypothetical protein